jgi:hypothetical protein
MIGKKAARNVSTISGSAIGTPTITQHDADQHRVDRGDQEDALDVGGERAPGALADLAQVSRRLLGEQADVQSRSCVPSLMKKNVRTMIRITAAAH